jgi:hypothetical protein
VYADRNDNSCNIYDSSFLGDLKPYTFFEDDASFGFKYEDGSQSTGLGSRLSYIKTIIDSNTPASTDIDDIWLPAIIDTGSYVNNKQVLMGTVIGNSVFGIENVLSFSNLKFKNWNMPSDVQLSIDWFINTDLSPIDIDYGLLCWYKKNTNHDQTHTIENVPSNIPLKCTVAVSYTENGQTYEIPKDTIVIKIDNYKLERKDTNAVIVSDTVRPNPNRIFQFSKVTNFTSLSIFKIVDKTNTVASSLSSYSLWIPDGDVNSFYNSSKDKAKRISKNIVSQTYLSPSLYHIYRSLYQALTVKKIRPSVPGSSPLDKSQSGRLRKLCSFLATSPLIDKVSINRLIDSSLYDQIYSTYIYGTNPNTEKQDLVNVLCTIFQKYRNESINWGKKNLSNNYVSSKQELFNKLTQKYGAFLSISGSKNIDFVPPLSNGAHALINMGIRTFVSKAGSGPFYNNCSITLGNIKAHTNMSTTKSECQFAYIKENNTEEPLKTLPLADISIKRKDKLKLDIGPDLILPTNSSYDFSVSDLDSTTATAYWFLPDGPDCIRFSDYNITPAQRGGRLWRFKSSTQTNPTIYTKDRGCYTLSCVATESGALRKSDSINVYVVDGNGEYAPGKTPTVFGGSDNTVSTEYKCMCPNWRQIAINKRGMVWFIDTDMYVTLQGAVSWLRTPERCINKQIPLEYFTELDSGGSLKASIVNANANLSINLNANSTVIKLSYISLQNMRDKDTINSDNSITKYNACGSFHEDRIYRKRETFSSSQGAITGAMRYYRKFDHRESYYKYTTDNNIDWFISNETVEFNFPPLSTVFSPSVPSYGGYSQQVIKDLGIDIPYHPIRINDQDEVYASASNLTWDCPVGLMCDEPAHMPALSDHNDMGGSDPNIRCHLKEIPISNSLTFTKGYFHPGSGWIYNNDSRYAEFNNKTSVQKYRTEDYGSYIFSGTSITDLKSSYNDKDNISNFIGSKIRFNGSIPYSSTYGLARYYGYRLPNGYLRGMMPYQDDMYVDGEGFSYVDFVCPYGDYSKYYSLIDHPDTSSLTIEDIEVRVNFLNYPNPKNLVMYLEVTGNSMPNPQPDYTKFYREYKDASTLGPVELQNYIGALNTMNSGNRLYLLNGDNIDNYGYFFSLKFSDNYGNNVVLDDKNKKTTNIYGDQDIADSSVPVRPTLSAPGYNDLDVSRYVNIINNNNMVIPSCSFSKFRGMNLTGTTFTLYVGTTEETEQSSAKDYTSGNNNLSGLSTIYNSPNSNSIVNNICSWEIIVHTKKNKQFNTADILGLISYSDHKTYDGYNFICDMTNKEYMIPFVNMNAPFNYLANINSCSSSDPDDASKSLTYRKIEFPFFYLPFTPFFTLVGALVATFELQQIFGAGGRSDPVVNMLLDLSFQRRQAEVESAVFQPIYTNYGYPYKAPVQISTDNTNWVHSDVSIFKYDHCPILTQNKYKYIKLTSNFGMAKFIAKKIKSLRELIDPKTICASITVATVPPAGLSVSDTAGNQHTFYQDDMVEVNGTVYVVKSQNWVVAPDTASLQYLATNKVAGNTTFTQAYISAKQLVMIDGARAYYYFSENDNIKHTDGSTKINKKALINIGGQYKTILTLSDPIPNDILEIYKNDNDSNVILVYKDYITDKDLAPISKWSFAKTAQQRSVNFPVFHYHSALGEGSWSYGTNFLEPEIFQKLYLYDNEILDAPEMLDCKYNNKYKPYDISVIDASNGNITKLIFDPKNDDAKNSLTGYAFSTNDFGLNIHDNFLVNHKIISPVKFQEIEKILKQNVVLESSNGAPFFMDLKSDKFKSIPASGEIIIEDDFISKTPLPKLTTSELTMISDRLATLESSIKTRLTEYHKTPEDPIDCLASEPTSDCPKKELLSTINNLTDERNSLRTVLSQNDNAIDGLSSVSRTITQDSTTKKINIQYDYKNYYWINIDKNQEFFQSQDAIPKILYKIRYNCVPVVEFYTPPACDSICGSSRQGSLNTNIDEIMQNSIEYTLPEDQIAKEKAKYPSVTDWAKEGNNKYAIYEKKFFLVCNDAEAGYGNSPDVLVYVTEEYLYPVGTNMFDYATNKNLNLDNKNSINLRFRNIPRKLKTIDPIYWVYRYDYNGNLGRDVTPSPGGFMSSNLAFWHCFGHNDIGAEIQSGNNFYGKLVEPPDFYKMQNEMIFRAFFGSVDGVEHKNSDISSTKEMWEWIPYEYYNKPFIE